MDSDVTESAVFYRLWDWGEAHRKQLLIVLIAVIVVGLGIAFHLVHQNQLQIDANTALSRLMVRTSPNEPEPTAQSFLKVAADYPNTDAGQRAQLLGASTLFVDGKYDEARGQFQRFLEAHSDSPFAGQATLGVAASLEAQGKTDEAINAYRNVADHYQSPNVWPQAKMALARLLEGQRKFSDAESQLEDVARAYPPQVPASMEARQRLGELVTEHPELMPTNAPAENPVVSRLRSAVSTNVTVGSTNPAHPPTVPLMSTPLSTSKPPSAGSLLSTNKP